MHYVLEDVQNQQACVGVQQPQTVVCVLKAAEAVLVIAQQALRCSVVLQQVVFVRQDHLTQTAELFVITVVALLVVALTHLAAM
jgi:hypothetical protein